jgi:hypothetical protein
MMQHSLGTVLRMETILNIGRTSVRNKVLFIARFYFALLTLHVSAPFSGRLQVVRKHKKYIQDSHYIFNGSDE